MYGGRLPVALIGHSFADMKRSSNPLGTPSSSSLAQLGDRSEASPCCEGNKKPKRDSSPSLLYNFTDLDEPSDAPPKLLRCGVRSFKAQRKNESVAPKTDKNSTCSDGETELPRCEVFKKPKPVFVRPKLSIVTDLDEHSVATPEFSGSGVRSFRAQQGNNESVAPKTDTSSTGSNGETEQQNRLTSYVGDSSKFALMEPNEFRRLNYLLSQLTDVPEDYQLSINKHFNP